MTVTTVPEVHPVMALIAGRLAAGGRTGEADDQFRLALAVEGGGMRGTISAGMALGLHELGLTAVFDGVYGSSAGAITGAWLYGRQCPRAGGADVAPHPALVLIAEADGNRTRQRRGTPLSGFEDRRRLGRACR